MRQCLESATTGYGRKVKEELGGGTPINRPEHVVRRGRLIKKLTGKSTWFCKTTEQQGDAGTPSEGAHQHLKNSRVNKA